MSNDYLSRHLASREDDAQEKYILQDEDVSCLMLMPFFFLPSREPNSNQHSFIPSSQFSLLVISDLQC
jgi:hypothetical protein